MTLQAHKAPNSQGSNLPRCQGFHLFPAKCQASVTGIAFQGSGLGFQPGMEDT